MHSCVRYNHAKLYFSEVHTPKVFEEQVDPISHLGATDDLNCKVLGEEHFLMVDGYCCCLTILFYLRSLPADTFGEYFFYILAQ
jgi:hypothetical protein